ncbi:retrotransposable element Tf2, partial [Tanacetum coccineum]
WLSLAEWWYNTNHHYAINTTPYEVVYGQSSPVHVPYVGGESKPHRQVTIRKGKQHKFSPKYYGPFQIMARVGQVAYKLQLPDSSQILDVFHISQLKKCKGIVTHSGNLPACDAQGVMRIEPLSILERRMAKRRNTVVVYVLVQWTNGSREDATWEPIEEIQKKFPSFNI